MKKKVYMRPEMEVVKIASRGNLLVGSINESGNILTTTLDDDDYEWGDSSIN